MSNPNQTRLAAAMIAIVAGAAGSMAQGVLNLSTGGSTVKSGIAPEDIFGQQDFNRWISDETIATNQQIWENRVEIAAMAQWIGPGPGNIQPIVAGDQGWLDDLREEAEAEFRRSGDRNIPITRVLAEAASRVKDRLADVGEPGLNGGGTGPGGNEAHRVNRLWPTVLVNGSYLAQIPYSFDDEMIDAWNNRADPDQDPVEQNAVAGIASSLATMLILEQLAPVRFVGFNPQVDPENGFLLFSNSGDAEFDPATGIGVNTVSRIGRANTANDDEEPTNLAHETWANFPSIVRSLGFVLGLDWEQRHPDRDTFITVQPQNILPQDFPLPPAPLDGNQGPGVTAVNSPDPDLDNPTTAGPLLFDDLALITISVDTPGCGFDLDSIMLLRPFDLGGAATYIINDAFRYVDLSGDGNIDTTPFGDDDRMASQPPSVFFSDCDIAALFQMYSVSFRWYYGLNPNCPHDVNNDGIQGGDDLQAFVALWEAGDPSADLVPPFGTIDLLDLRAFSLGDDDNNIDIFTPGFCNPFGPPGPGFRPGGNVFPPDG